MFARLTGPLLLACLLATACTNDNAGGAGDAGNDGTIPEQVDFGGDRPVQLRVPKAYDHARPTPLLLLLHGYGANGHVQAAYMGLYDLVDEAGVLLVNPEGTVDSTGKQFWNATGACCDFDGTGVDDVAYLSGLVEDIAAVWNVDRDRIYILGHSNGGFMAYRMACERADLFAGVASLAGAANGEVAACDPTEPVSVLQIHGTDDSVIFFDGRQECSFPGCQYPSAAGSVGTWAAYDGCGDTTSAGAAVDIESQLAGAETAVERFDDCPAGIAAELWTIEAGSHLPSLSADFRAEVWRWMSAHPKP